MPCLHTVDRCLAAIITVSRVHFLSLLTMWERPHCPFCAMISVLRSAFLFSSLSQIPTSFYFLLFVSPLYNPSLFTCDRSPLPFPTSGLYGELANQKLSSAPPPASQAVGSLCADFLSRDVHPAMGWVERGLSREACEERFKARPSWNHRGPPISPGSSLLVLNC